MLKKIIPVLMILLLFTSCSMTKKPSPEEISGAYEKDFSACGVMCFDDVECEAILEKSGKEIRLSVIETGNISEISAKTDGKTVRAEYGELSQEFDFAFLPEKMPVKLFYCAFSMISQPEKISISFSENEITVTGEDFTAVLSSENSALIRMDFPRYGFKFFAEKFAFSEQK